MKEYQLVDKEFRPIKFEDINIISKSIEKIFQKGEIINGKGWTRRTYMNGEEFYIYSNSRKGKTKILLPEKYDEIDKEKLEILAELKCVEIN